MSVKDVAIYEDLNPDPFTVVRVLGTGVGSMTQLVKMGENSPLYVRKTITEEFANTEAWKALERVSHPLVPRVLEQYWRDGCYEVVYDYVPGESLAEFIKRNGTLNERYAASIMIDVADAASALHAAGIVHRDISPGNVIIDLKGRAHLTDLGIARVVEAGQSRDTTRLGTWGFAAPEQYGFAQTDARSDVYSMGRLLAYACTGRMPEVASDSFDDAQYGLDALSPSIASVIRTACAFEPSARFQSAKAFATALSSCMGSTATTETRTAPVESGMVIIGNKGPNWQRALGWIALIAWVFMTLIFSMAVVGAFTSTEPVEDPIGSFLLALAGFAISAYCVFQTWNALMLRGAFKQRERRVIRLLCSYGIAILAFFAVLLVLAIASAIVTAVMGGAA